MEREKQHPVGGIKAAIASRLLGGYVDGQVYIADEWSLKKLRFSPRANSYYALIEIESETAPTAVYEIYHFERDIDYLSSYPNHVGYCEADFPDDAVEVPVCSWL